MVEDYKLDPVSKAYARFFESEEARTSQGMRPRHARALSHCLAHPAPPPPTPGHPAPVSYGCRVGERAGAAPNDPRASAKKRKRHAMPKQIITSSSSPTTGFTDKATPSPLAQAIRFGNMLFLSGQGPLDPETREVVSTDIQEQTRQTLSNLERILDAAGATFANVVNMRVCLRDTADFPKFNEAFTEYMQGEKVTRTCIAAAPLTAKASTSRSTASRCSTEERMRAGWRPERRNRKIGTAASGRGHDNRMRVPERYHDGLRFYERLGPHRTTEERLNGQPLTVFAERARTGCTFGCSPRDVLHLVANLPAADVRGLRIIVMRQPTRKQEVLRPVWGRCVFDANFGSRRGPAIILEAIDLTQPLQWSRKVSFEDRAELERLVEDGHRAIKTRRGTTLVIDRSSVRSTVLYRTLLHEIGHWTDWRNRVLKPGLAPDRPRRRELEIEYFARPKIEREHAAHRYAADQAERLRSRGVIPFDLME